MFKSGEPGLISAQGKAGTRSRGAIFEEFSSLPRKAIITILCIAISAGIAFWGYSVVPKNVLLPTLALGLSLAALSYVDITAYRLPDIMVLPLGLLGMIMAYILFPDRLAENIIGLGVGGLSAYLIALCYRLLRGCDGLGFGDVKLMAAGGAWVSWTGIPSVFAIASFAGLSYVALSALWTSRSLTLNSRLPFGPFIGLGIWITWPYWPILNIVPRFDF